MTMDQAVAHALSEESGLGFLTLPRDESFLVMPQFARFEGALKSLHQRYALPQPANG
jgi:hypothetical protein